jgi:hypothetical protein
MFKHDISNEIANRVVRAKSPSAQAVAFRLLRLAEFTADADAKHRQNKSLSEWGRVDNVRTDLVKMRLTNRFALGRRAVQRETEKIATMRADLEKKAFEAWATDGVAAEIRAALKGNTMAEAIKLADGNSRILAAIVGVPSLLTGITKEATAHLVESYLGQHHSDALAKIDIHKEAVAAAAAALQVATNTMKEAANFPSDKALEDWLGTNGPSKSDFETEDAGRSAPGQPTFNSVLSEQYTGDDSLVGLAA